MIDMEELLFLFVDHIKKFHSFLTQFYQLRDLPYNLSGKVFPKKGELVIDGINVSYHFHGNGCTLLWNGLEIEYSIDAISKHDVKLGAYGLCKFVNASVVERNGSGYSFEEMTKVLEELESKGVLMERLPADMGTWHVNELWYQSYKKGIEFTGLNKSEIDWE